MTVSASAVRRRTRRRLTRSRNPRWSRLEACTPSYAAFMCGSVRPSSVSMPDRKPSAATQAPPSVAITPNIANMNAIDIALLMPDRGLAGIVAVPATGAATPTALAGPAGRGSVGGTLEFGISSLEFGKLAVECRIAGGESEIGNLESGVWTLDLERAF